MAKDTLRLDKAVCHNFDLTRSVAVKLIRQGLCEVEGEVVTDPSLKIASNAAISLDGCQMSADEGFKKQIYMLNKPDGYDMVAPSGEGAYRCMKQALATANGPVDYINTHGTATVLGDIKELEAIGKVFTDKCPAISSTKSMTGHALGAAGVNEAIFSLLMMSNNFIAPSINIDTLDDAAKGFDIVANTARDAKLNRIMSNSFGFGGTNASLILAKYN